MHFGGCGKALSVCQSANKMGLVVSRVWIKEDGVGAAADDEKKKNAFFAFEGAYLYTSAYAWP